MASLQSRPAQRNAWPVIFHSPPPLTEPQLSLSVEALKFHIMVSFHAVLIQEEPNKTKKETAVAVPFGFATLDWLWDVNDFPPPHSNVASGLAPFVI